MQTHTIGIILNGVTGRMGTNQHLLRSIHALREQGGLQIGPEEFILPDPVLVGRNQTKLNTLCARTGLDKTSTNLDEVLADPQYSIYFDSQTTDRRVAAVTQAIAAGKHIYCEKPTALTTSDALKLHTLAESAGGKHGVVQDKLWLPGLLKLKTLIDDGFFGELLSVRGEFGYWVFGGIIMDMVCHWRYVLDNVFGPVKSLSCLGATHVPKRWDENGEPYAATADDACYATFELGGSEGQRPIIAQMNSSWTVRVRRDDLLTLQVDGRKGSAVATLRDVYLQPMGGTPKPVWNPDIPQPINFYEGWQKMPEQTAFDNAFKVQWELFLKHVVRDDPFPWTLLEGAKGVQLAELALQSWSERRWLDVPELG